MPSDARAARTTVGGQSLVRREVVSIDCTTFSVAAPIAGIPELITAFDQERIAAAIRPTLLEDLDARSLPPHQLNDKAVFDLRQAAGTAVTAVKTGVEGYVNWHVQRIEAGQPGTLNYAAEIYRELPDRIRELPNLLALEGPHRGIVTQQPWWQTLRRAMALADLVRHGVTTQETRKGLTGDRSLLDRLCRGEEAGCAQAMLALFEFITPGYVPNAVRYAVDAVSTSPP